MEDRLDMATRRRLTNRFKDEYAKAPKKEKKLILDRLVEVGMGRSTARRLSRGIGAAGRQGPSGTPVQTRFQCFASMFVDRQCFSACGLMVFPGNVIVSR